MSVVVVVGWRVPLANLPFLGYEPLVPTNPSLTLAPSNNPCPKKITNPSTLVPPQITLTVIRIGINQPNRDTNIQIQKHRTSL